MGEPFHFMGGPPPNHHHHPQHYNMNDTDHGEEVIGGDAQTLMQMQDGGMYPGENEATMMPHMHPPFPFGSYHALKVPLPSRKEGEAPQFVFWKQAQRIEYLRKKRDFNEPTRFFTRRRTVSYSYN